MGENKKFEARTMATAGGRADRARRNRLEQLQRTWVQIYLDFLARELSQAEKTHGELSPIQVSFHIYRNAGIVYAHILNQYEQQELDFIEVQVCMAAVLAKRGELLIKANSPNSPNARIPFQEDYAKGITAWKNGIVEQLKQHYYNSYLRLVKEGNENTRAAEKALSGTLVELKREFFANAQSGVPQKVHGADLLAQMFPEVVSDILQYHNAFIARVQSTVN